MADVGSASFNRAATTSPLDAQRQQQNERARDDESTRPLPSASVAPAPEQEQQPGVLTRIVEASAVESQNPAEQAAQQRAEDAAQRQQAEARQRPEADGSGPEQPTLGGLVNTTA
jgi:hypothetical protein